MATKGEAYYKDFFENNNYDVDIIATSDKKTPDFILKKDGEALAYCEIKDIEDLSIEYFIYESKEIPDDVIVMMNKIERGARQLHNFNQDHNIPNILGIYCNRIGMNAIDLQDALFGYIDSTKGHLYTRRAKGQAEERLKKYARFVDIYLFYDATDDKTSVIYNISKFSKEFYENYNLIFNIP